MNLPIQMVLNLLNVYRIKLVAGKKAIPAGIALAASGLILSLTNPSLDDYRTFWGDQLIDISTKEFCFNSDIPLIVRLLVEECPRKISRQRPFFEALAGKSTKRINLGLCSFYITKFGGQKILPNLQLPSYKATTFAALGRFMTFNVESDQGRLD